MIVCKYCKREFNTEFAFYAHKCEGYVKERQELKKQKEEENNNGEFVCNGCGKHYKNANSVRSHARFCENYQPIKKYDENGNYISNSKYKIGDIYKCECGREFNNPQALNGHLSYCDIHHQCVGTERKSKYSEKHHSNGWENKTREEIQAIIKKRKQRIKNGELTPV